jgi:hypothetical protein
VEEAAPDYHQRLRDFLEAYFPEPSPFERITVPVTQPQARVLRPPSDMPAEAAS